MIHHSSCLVLLSILCILDHVHGGYISPLQKQKGRDRERNALPLPHHIAKTPFIPPNTNTRTEDVLNAIFHGPHLSRYTCPSPHNSLIKKTVAPDITMPRAQLIQILTELRSAEEKIVEMLSDPAIPPVEPGVVVVETVAPPILGGEGGGGGKMVTTMLTATISLTSTTTVWTQHLTPTSIITPVLEGEGLAVASQAPIPILIPDHFSPNEDTGETGSAPVVAIELNETDITMMDLTVSGRFNAGAKTNVAVYYGQTYLTSSTPLTTLCADPAVNIVVLAFITSTTSSPPSKYPTLNLGASCGGQTPTMARLAPGLLFCPLLAEQIKTCQSKWGKKVMISIGGATGNVQFGGEKEAREFGDLLWGLFGPVGAGGGGVDKELRPFGEVVLDGFDIDTENAQPSHLTTLATTLRSHFTHQSKTFYLTAAPQCPFPDSSMPTAMLLLCDFVWVQFYNNPSCEIGSVGFVGSVRGWSKALEGSKLGVKTRFYVGAPGFGDAGPAAYASMGSAEGIKSVVKSVVDMKLPNLGGAMFWDGSMGEANVEGGKNIMAWAKAGLIT